ncbi:hypothetical protein Avbf_14025, partial [Armadillidium vulgare]
MKHRFQWFQSSIVVFFIISVFDPLSDLYLNYSNFQFLFITHRQMYLKF